MTGFQKFALMAITVVGAHDLLKPFCDKMGWIKVEKEGDKMSVEAKAAQEMDRTIDKSEVTNGNS